MWKLAFVLAAVVLSAGPTLCQTATSGTAEPWADKLFGKRITHDFGTVAHGAQLKHSFPIRNIYNVPLTLTIPKVSCGCVTATLNKDGKPGINAKHQPEVVLQPQEEATLDIVMDSRKFNGSNNVNVTVTIGPEYISTSVLKVSAVARSDVVFNPGDVNFGVVAQGQQPEQVIDIEYAGLLDFRIKEVVKQENAPFSVVMKEQYRVAPNGKQPGRAGYRMTVKLAADAPAGVLKQDLVLKTNDPASEVLIVSVDGTIQSALRVTPEQVNFGGIKLGETKTFKVQVVGARPFRITAIKSDGAGEVSADVPTQALALHTLTLRCQPSVLGELKRTVTIETDLERNASVTVTIQAAGTQ